MLMQEQQLQTVSGLWINVKGVQPQTAPCGRIRRKGPLCIIQGVTTGPSPVQVGTESVSYASCTEQLAVFFRSKGCPRMGPVERVGRDPELGSIS